MYEDVIEWEAMEFEPHEKGSDWFWILGIIVVVGALIAVFIDNVLFAVIIILGGFIIGVYATKQPDILYCRIDRRGLHVNDQTYLFNHMDTFWIDETREDRPKLLITPRKKLSIQIAVPLQNVDIDDVHDYMDANVEEEEQNESIAEQVIEWLKI